MGLISFGCELFAVFMLAAHDEKPRDQGGDEQLRWEVPSPECAVPGCTNSKTTTPDRSFFRFPIHTVNRFVKMVPPRRGKAFDILGYKWTNFGRSQHWVIACRRPDLLDKSTAFLNHHYAICSDHFRPDQFTNSSKKVLKRKAVPSVFNWRDDTEMIISDTFITEGTQGKWLFKGSSSRLFLA